MQIEKFSNRLSKHGDLTHIDVFNTVQSMIKEGCSLNDLSVFDMNIISKLLMVYYNQYCLCKYDDNSDELLGIKITEVTLPLQERTSGILEELNWLIKNGYDLNSHVMFEDYNDEKCDFLDFPVTQVFAYPSDLFMAEWLINQGCGKQLEIILGDNDSLADWCFDNLDICSEDFVYSKSDVSIVCKLTADLVRILLEHGCHHRCGLWMSVDEKNMVSFHSPHYMF